MQIIRSNSKRYSLIILVLLCIFITITGCKKDEIKIGEGDYSDGGKGTSSVTGAVVFSSTVRGQDVLVVTLQGDQVDKKQTIQRVGQAFFLNLKPGDYSYSVEYYGRGNNSDNNWDFNRNGGFNIDLVTGKVITIPGTRIPVNSNDYYFRRRNTKNAVLTVKSNKTLKIKIGV